MGTRGRERVVLRSIIAVLAVFVISQFLSGGVVARIGPGDFVEYWAASRIFLQQGNPYDFQALLAAERAAGWSGSDPLVPFTPPWSLPLFLPFSVLPFWYGRIAWFIVSFVLVIIAGDSCWRTYRGDLRNRWIGWLCAMLFIPTAMSLHLGQITPLLLSGILGFGAAIRRGRHDLAGCAIALISVKPHLLPVFWLFLVLWVVSKRRWSLLVNACLANALLVLATVAINPRIFEFYLGLFRSAVAPLAWQTPTWGTALRLTFPEGGSWLSAAPTLLGIVIGALLWRRWGVGFEWQSRLPAILLVSAIAAPYAWTFDWIVLVPAVIQITVHALRQRSLRGAVLLGALILAQVAIAVQSYYRISNLYTIWFPPLIAMLYWTFGCAQASVERQSPGQDTPGG
jgi:hypothetical protein